MLRSPRSRSPWQGLLLLASLHFLACSPQTATEDATTATTREQAEAFFQVYAERADFEAFLDFYAQDAVLEDIINGDLIEGRDALRTFFDWGNPRVVMTQQPTLVVSSLVVENRQAVARGYFAEFLYDGQPLGPWRFVITLELDDEGKIQRQEDFINYPASLLDPERASTSDSSRDGRSQR